MGLNINTSTLRRNGIGLDLGRAAKAVTAALVLVLVLVLGAIAASPSLHQRLQNDGNHHDHFCFICALASGQLNVADTSPIVATACVFLICGVLAAEPPLVSRFNFSFSPSRAPPRL